ncbi:MAG: hypothetical protein K6U14_09870 [Firmicutes bacterium]|nr:hypothetical protein [Alicyclobacillaceae bacterium]MCL6497920.1 hypothetical protein [Bacillota bacterium]
MEVTLRQLIEISPELAPVLREEIHAGRLPAERRPGLAGRPYIIPIEALKKSSLQSLQALGEKAEHLLSLPVANRGKSPWRMPGPEEGGVDWWGVALRMLESQHLMLREVVDLLSREMARRTQGIEKREEEIRELSYKLGQAHQEILRLERQLAAQNLARAE